METVARSTGQSTIQERLRDRHGPQRGPVLDDPFTDAPSDPGRPLAAPR